MAKNSFVVEVALTSELFLRKNVVFYKKCNKRSFSNSRRHAVIAETIANLYIEKKHYHVAKKLRVSVLYGTLILYFNPMIFRLEHLALVENTVIHFQDYRQEINTL